MNILEKANDLVNGQRQEDYGDAHQNHQRIAGLWTVYFYGRSGPNKFTATDAALMMDLVKTARLMQSPDHVDSYVDKAGYAQVAQRCAEVDYGPGSSDTEG